MTKHLFTCGAGLLAAACALAVHAGPPPGQPISLVNPGFEADGASVASPYGWTSLGNSDADFLEWGGQASAESYRLSHWAGSV